MSGYESVKRKYESAEESQSEEEEDNYFDEYYRRNFFDDNDKIDTARTIRSNPRLAEIFEEASSLQTTEGDVCLGHAFATLMGQSIMGTNHDIVNLNIYPDDTEPRVLTYNRMVSMFSDPTTIKEGASFYIGENVTAHGTLICFYKNKNGDIFTWYYNPWGTQFEEINLGVVTRKISENVKEELLSIYQRGYRADERSIPEITQEDMYSMSSLYQKHPSNQNEVVNVYMLEKMKHLCPESIKEKMKDFSKRVWLSDNTITELLRMMKLYFGRNEITVIPMRHSNTHIGVQQQYNDGIEVQRMIVRPNTRSYLEKTVQNNYRLGSCAIWVILYSKIVYAVLNGVEEKEMILEVIKKFMPEVQLMGEANVRILLAKIVMINGVGRGIFDTMRRFFELLPDKGTQSDDYFKIVIKNYDIAIKNIHEGWDKSKWYNNLPKRRPDHFNPDRYSPRVEHVMNFIKSVAKKDMSDDDSRIIRQGIVLGGYLTNSSWDMFMNILLLVISCKLRKGYHGD